MTTRSILLLATASCLLVPGALAQDWPGWRGRDLEGRLKGFEVPSSWPAKLKKGWSVEVGTGYSTPALVGDRLFVQTRQGEDEVMMCFNAATGVRLWRTAYPMPYKVDPSARAHGKGPKASPTVVDGRVFWLSIDGALTCLDATTGSAHWRHDFKEEFKLTSPECGASGSPYVVDGLCIIHAGGLGKGALMAFDVKEGKRKWSWAGDGPGYATPILKTIGGQRQLITLTEANAVAVSPVDGSLQWKVKFETQYIQNTVSPVLAGDILVLSGYQRGVTGFRPSARGLETVWHERSMSMYMSSPVLKGTTLIGYGQKRKGQFFAQDSRTGKMLWTGPGGEGENAAILDAGEVIIALTTDSNLIVFRAHGEKYEELARYEVADSPTWAHPVVSGRAIYVKDATTLTCWTIPE